ncbi:hypothetical protein IQ07DRAFT_583454 [Pyrenochaeta sp. DS3sAY3a]|nr:hypothetical protein IQ07DRAFT_583454 [Pyrenochaeta sp. DS3sAY3a]
MTTRRDAAQRDRGERPSKQRSRASVACQSCRQRKIKCDAQDLRPGTVCTNCRASGTACVLNPDSDRRKFGSRDHIAQLQERLISIESLMRNALTNTQQSADPEHEHTATSVSPSADITILDHDPSLPDMPAVDTLPTHHDAALEQSMAMLHNPIHDPASPINPLTGPKASTGQDQRPTDPAQPMDLQALAAEPAPPQSRTSHGIQPLTTTATAKDAHEDNITYFGPTSESHVSSPSETFGLKPPQFDIPGVQLQAHSPQLKAVLIRSYWRWQPLSITVIHQKSFLSHRNHGSRSQYYSKFLEFALLACGTRLSTSKDVRALGPEYAKLAYAEYISPELDNSNVATLQGLLLLSDFEMSQSRDRVGWLHCGMACRLIFDLGLHDADMTSKGFVGSATEFDAFRGTLLTACLVYERLWCLYLGRPSCVTASMLRIPPPTQDASRDAMVDAWLGLCEPMSEITSILNSSQPMGISASRRLVELDDQLKAWASELPLSLKYKENDAWDMEASAYGLHMQYFRVRILLHRGHRTRSSRKRKADEIDLEPVTLHGWSTEKSKAVIYSDATSIARLGLAYKQIYGTENTPSIMLDNLYAAARILIIPFLRSPERSRENDVDTQWLRSLDEMLEALRTHFPIVARMRKTLSRLLQGTRLSHLFSDRSSVSSMESINPSTWEASTGQWGSFDAAIDDFLDFTAFDTSVSFCDNWSAVAQVI